MAKGFPNVGDVILDSSSDLPSSPFEGQTVYEKDSNKFKVYNGASWVEVLDLDTTNALSTSAQSVLDGKLTASRIQTGRASIGAGAGQVTVTFATPFANTNFTLVVSGNRGTSDNPAMVWTSDITTTNFIVYARNPTAGVVGGTCVINWIAIAD